MREGFGRTAYCLTRAAKAITILLAFAFFAVLCAERCLAAPIDGGAGKTQVAFESNNTTYVDELTPAITEEAEDKTVAADGAEPTPSPKPKKQLAAEQYALGVILAGGIALGMMVALFFYYTKQNNIHRD